MHIVKFQAENVKRLKAIEINPKDPVVRITGKNDQGKSSVLDTIMMVLAGKRHEPEQPLRRGTEAGFGRVELSNGLVVTKRVTAKDTYLEVTSREGATYKSPQAMLDRLFGTAQMFDPLAFARMDPKDQLDELKRICGIDTTLIDGRILQLREDRRAVGRSAKDAAAAAGENPHPDCVAVDVKISDFTLQLQQAIEIKHANEQKRRALDALVYKATVAEGWEKKANDALEKEDQRHASAMKALQREIDLANSRHSQYQLAIQSEAADDRDRMAAWAKEIKETSELVASLVDPDLDAIQKMIGEAEIANAKVGRIKAWHARKAQAVALITKHQQLEAALEKAEAERRDAIAKSPMPIAGLGLNDDGVTFEGVPLNQCSQSGRVRVSAAIGLARMPKTPDALHVMCIRDGSLLDSETQAALIEFLLEGGLEQLWIEETTDGGPLGVVIHDGQVQEFAGAAADVAEAEVAP